MNENFYTNVYPLMNQHNYHIIEKEQYNEEADNIYNVNKSSTINIQKIGF